MSADNQLVHVENSRPIVIVTHLRSAYSGNIRLWGGHL